MWTIFKVFIEVVTALLLLFMFWFLAGRHRGSQLPRQGSNPHPLHWKAKSQPLDRQGSPPLLFLFTIFFNMDTRKFTIHTCSCLGLTLLLELYCHLCFRHTCSQTINT